MILDRFLDPATPSLKICGVTLSDDAHRLADLGVEAIGVNFWPKSKRYHNPKSAAWLKELKGKVTRVGVFVNQDINDAIELVRAGLIDAVQLHGDETPYQASALADWVIPYFKAFGVKTAEDLTRVSDYDAAAILLDTAAPGVYGGTGEVFDWSVAAAFVKEHQEMPVILAGGITPENAATALTKVNPAALDVASGAEISPGIKDFDKVEALLKAVRASVTSA